MTRAIGLVVADVTNAFYGEIIKGAAEAARTEGYEGVDRLAQRHLGLGPDDLFAAEVEGQHVGQGADDDERDGGLGEANRAGRGRRT